MSGHFSWASVVGSTAGYNEKAEWGQVWSSQEDDKVVPDYICMWNAGGKAEGEDQLEVLFNGEHVCPQWSFLAQNFS